MHRLPWSAARQLRRARIVLSVVLVVVVAGFIASGLHATPGSHGGGRAPEPTPADASTPVVLTRPLAARPAAGLAPIPSSADPVAFATAVARALFDWDTTGPHTLADLKGRLLVVADPSGVESPGLVTDVGSYLPSTPTWDFLAQYDTRQWIEITAATVPGQWREVVAAAEGALAPGTTALTVTGVRHRAGVWEGHEVTERFAVTFTVIVVCGPTYPQCYLLRLSRLDEPLP